MNHFNNKEQQNHKRLPSHQAVNRILGNAHVTLARTISSTTTGSTGTGLNTQQHPLLLVDFLTLLRFLFLHSSFLRPTVHTPFNTTQRERGKLNNYKGQHRRLSTI
ncbi:hypothetical protein VTL71DRAFT_8886 [Oculimacula yallundae]|uniref:Uncharacterized protein n=1 Tax=Oculimacula yallundae TaxID=86028 RepID=A0ABR4BT72_9HELO